MKIPFFIPFPSRALSRRVSKKTTTVAALFFLCNVGKTATLLCFESQAQKLEKIDFPQIDWNSIVDFLLRIPANYPCPLFAQNPEYYQTQVNAVNRLVNGNEEDCYEQLRVNRFTFLRLCYLVRSVGLGDSRTFVPVNPPLADRPRYRSKKGDLATNVLGVCTQDLQFVFVLSSWEGSATDSRILKDAITRPNGLKVPREHYYLVDAGYTNGDGFLAPYRGERYHLNIWRQGHMPTSKEEYFNMKHSAARNVIERCFGVLKIRFAILRSPSYYPIRTQCRIVIACCLAFYITSSRERCPTILLSLSTRDGNKKISTISRPTRRRPKRFTERLSLTMRIGPYYLERIGQRGPGQRIQDKWSKCIPPNPLQDSVVDDVDDFYVPLFNNQFMNSPHVSVSSTPSGSTPHTATPSSPTPAGSTPDSATPSTFTPQPPHVCKESLGYMEKLANSLGYEKELAARRATILGELEKLDLTLIQQFKLAAIIGDKEERVNQFLNTRDERKQAWAEAVLNGHVYGPIP
ncbi:hypothetical protein Acr_00g0026220 [Actinidia rufa]|uniref:DDE Tnp4 domain-containing protein n=1 Tax=Actinidia rufa TaxID=165716 RepID=A0A7J0DEX5_9ERIC|nr:hypothetical protein Acr_00g0026220 [Actinidia rufa]